MNKESFKLSKKEHNYISVLKQVVDGSVPQSLAAVKLNISKRHMIRLVARFRKAGSSGIVHRGRNKPSPRKLPQEKRDEILSLIKTHYHDYSAVFAAESLQKYHAVTIHPETLRRLLGRYKKRKIQKQHRQWRERKEYYGEMVQLDGSLHDWFEGRYAKSVLLAYIDDATSTILYLQFVKRESVKSLMTTTQLYIKKHGKPKSFYTDRGSTFKVTTNNPDNIFKTQFERALQKLGIKIIHARSSQAKGRVERLFGTLQDRLVKELRRNGIASLDEANHFLITQFLPEYGTKWAQAPLKEGDLHRPLSSHENLDVIFVIECERSLYNDFTISYKNHWFQLTKEQPTTLYPRNKILVQEELDGTLHLSIRSHQLNFIEIAQKPKKNRKYHKKKVFNPWFPDEDSLFCGTLKKFT